MEIARHCVFNERQVLLTAFMCWDKPKKRCVFLKLGKSAPVIMAMPITRVSQKRFRNAYPEAIKINVP